MVIAFCSPGPAPPGQRKASAHRMLSQADHRTARKGLSFNLSILPLLAGFHPPPAVAFANLPLPTLPQPNSVFCDRSLFSPSNGLRKHEEAEGTEYYGQWYYGTFDCGITWLGTCVGSEVTVVAREINVDHVGVRNVRKDVPGILVVQSTHRRSSNKGPLVDRSSGMTTAFSYSGGDPLEVVPGWSGSVCHRGVSVQPLMIQLNVKIQ